MLSNDDTALHDTLRHYELKSRDLAKCVLFRVCVSCVVCLSDLVTFKGRLPVDSSEVKNERKRTFRWRNVLVMLS